MHVLAVRPELVSLMRQGQIDLGGTSQGACLFQVNSEERRSLILLSATAHPMSCATVPCVHAYVCVRACISADISESLSRKQPVLQTVRTNAQ